MLNRSSGSCSDFTLCKNATESAEQARDDEATLATSSVDKKPRQCISMSFGRLRRPSLNQNTALLVCFAVVRSRCFVSALCCLKSALFCLSLRALMFSSTFNNDACNNLPPLIGLQANVA